ncbi:L,D-transpeptidase family protein [Lusitaniella coriacea]|uniref:L,D-transpeptidase family protein n=1 Tax=Lusitaniella coriacea TaxID=1983105 RepID=UPI003CEB5B42
MPLKFTSRQRSWIAVLILFLCGSVGYFILYRGGWLPAIAQVPKLFTTNLSQPLPPADPALNSDRLLNSLLGENIDKTQTAIAIDKSDYRLTLYYQGQPIKSYPIVLGGNPTADKRKEGDRATPEGIFAIRDLYPHPGWSKFIWLDYPSAQSWRNHFQAKLQGAIPWYASVGSEVGIHGVPDGSNDLIETRNNWTLGCISLKNSDVDELYAVLQAGNRVEIVP